MDVPNQPYQNPLQDLNNVAAHPESNPGHWNARNHDRVPGTNAIHNRQDDLEDFDGGVDGGQETG